MTSQPDAEQMFAQQVLDQLAASPYACSALSRLGGGTANFLYRGTLCRQPPASSDANTRTVIVKCSTAYVATNRAFPLDVTRCVFENAVLTALAGFPRTISTGIMGDENNDNDNKNSKNDLDIDVRVPQVLFFNTKTHLQILQDFHDTCDLTTILKSPSVDDILPTTGSGPTSMGRALGSWLRVFHDWASDAAQDDLVARVGDNKGMRELKCRITYDSVIEILERYPEILGGHRDTFLEVKQAMRYEFERAVVRGDEDRGLIHGDFWGGNILLPNQPWHEPSQENPRNTTTNKLFIIDWENIQFGHRAIDLGGFLADMYERYHFKNVAASLPIMEGFMQGYGPISEDMACRVAIHAGVHLICWYYRRDRDAPLPFPLPKVLSALEIGRDLVLGGWKRDWVWLRSSILGSLFADEEIS